jgi:hypothetical protein
MANSINQQVIDFTTTYTSSPGGTINDLTVLAAIGIITYPDTVKYVEDLEDSFDLAYVEGDAIGIIIVGDATRLIEKKLR